MIDPNEPSKFLSFYNSKLYLIMDGLDRTTDGLERDCLGASDVDYALAQMTRVGNNVESALRVILAAKKMFAGTPKANAWKEISPKVPWSAEESDALDSVRASVDAWNERN